MPLTFWQDLKHRGLLPVKILLFIQAAGDMAVYPFLTLHMKYLGITVTEIGIQFALTPVATLLATPLVGLLADKIGNFKIMLSISLLLVAGLSQLFLLVPTSFDHRNLPRGEASLACSSKGNLMADLPLNFTSQARGYSSNSSADATHVRGLNVTLTRCKWGCTQLETSKICFVCSLGQKKCIDLSDSEKLLVNLNKNLDEDIGKWMVGNTKLENEMYETVHCEGSYSSCSAQCQVKLEEPPLIDPHRHKVTFWAYLALRILLYVIIATEMSLLKAACLTTIDKYDSEYGFQRIWPNIAACITPVITGMMMDRLQNGEVEDYNPCFYIFGAMKLLMAVIAWFVDLSPKPPTLDIWKNVIKLFKNPEVAIMLIYCTFVGSCWGYLETFLFWFLEGLGASKMLMGMTFTIGSAAGIIPSIFAGAIERKIGHVPIISIGLVAYAVRFVGYTFIPNAYYALIFEALECLTMSLMLITITTYANQLASTELIATMQATWAALHFAVGRALGSLVGGFLINSVGSVATYRIYAGKCIFMAVLYLLLYFGWLKRRSHGEKSSPVDQEKAERFTKKEDLCEKNGAIITDYIDKGKTAICLSTTKEELQLKSSQESAPERGDQEPRPENQQNTEFSKEGKENDAFQKDEDGTDGDKKQQ